MEGIVIFSLKTNEEIIAEVIAKGKDAITLKDPCYIIVEHIENEPIPRVALAALTPFGKPKAYIFLSHDLIKWYYTPSKKIESAWREQFGSGIVTSPSGSGIILPK